MGLHLKYGVLTLNQSVQIKLSDKPAQGRRTACRSTLGIAAPDGVREHEDKQRTAP